jgi:DNA modification methylase
MFMSSKYLPVVQDAWEYHEGIVDRWLAWVKTNPSVSSFRTVDFHSQFEWIMFGYKTGTRVPGIKTLRTNLFMFPKPAVNKLHPTQKPIEVIAPLIEDGTNEGEIVFDPFVGSGTTIIACEVLKRVCFACELDPRYVDTARRRWAEEVHGENCDWEALTPAVSAI